MADRAQEFEWDDDKAKINLAKHGISFERAAYVFGDPLTIDECDEEHSDSESRNKIVGLAQGKLIAVVYTERNGRIRIISARTATRMEHDDYYRQNQK